MTRLSPEQKDALISYSLEQGFDVARVTAADFGKLPGERLQAFLDAGLQGDMDWLENRKEWRKNPTNLWEEAKSALVLAINYGPDEDPRALADYPDKGIVSVYARGRDYHDVVKKRLKRIARWIVEQHGADVKVFVDTAPVMEKPLAAAAGVGWQGKHTNLLSREFGSWLFLGVILITADIDPDEKTKGDCGSCDACLRACPTNAFIAPYQLDARKCISYLTIETRLHIPRDMRSQIGNRIYGCDDCLAACPWNKYAQVSNEIAFEAKEALKSPNLEDLACLSDPEFRTIFSGSAVKRLGRNRFVRNVMVAIGNSGKSDYVPVIEERLQDVSDQVRLAAVWALGKVAASEEFNALKQAHYALETDPLVLEEWDLSGRELIDEQTG
ncbi:tRNA epoxyqueuosine(34) reductase QueG [Sneathiella sp. P13V-1]|uniref:tRNA epoxyqueuosine(34) reductase QueG n=1 Tax=Sneathiella sp. P13V-1 TaxID=2697366 RepID=UPI00187B2E53|nr:tRNA epoxyqueuosine(34) reductase QueG [Sneathiella sp. P13V-1]MBE7636194.1 tRNA epoxyqueuosine(34) reductase QueG [Sneathiella sp. P13V-1]